MLRMLTISSRCWVLQVCEVDGSLLLNIGFDMIEEAEVQHCLIHNLQTLPETAIPFTSDLSIGMCGRYERSLRLTL